MLEHTETIDVDRPPREVYDFLANSENEVRWRKDVVSSELVEGDGGQPGARYKQVMKPRRREVTGTHEIVAVEPGKRVDWRTPPGEGPIDFSGSYAVVPREGGSTVSLHTCVRARGLMRVGERFMKGYLRKLSRRYAEAIKDSLEGRTAQASPSN